jgi:hypothetical protein
METEATSTGWGKTKMDVANMLREFCSQDQ